MHPFFLMLVYGSDRNVAVHFHFPDMHGCLEVWQTLGCKIWEFLGKASYSQIVQALLAIEWLTGETGFHTSECKPIFFTMCTF